MILNLIKSPSRRTSARERLMNICARIPGAGSARTVVIIILAATSCPRTRRRLTTTTPSSHAISHLDCSYFPTLHDPGQIFVTNKLKIYYNNPNLISQLVDGVQIALVYILPDIPNCDHWVKHMILDFSGRGQRICVGLTNLVQDY